MRISRRSFFGVLATVAASAALDPERLLWVPGQRKIFIPAPARVLASADLRVGDVFTIAGRYCVNPFTGLDVQSRDGLKLPQQFVVVEDVRRGQEVLARSVSASVVERYVDGDWVSDSRWDSFNPEPLSPGDHRTEPPSPPRLVGPGRARPASSARGFALRAENLDLGARVPVGHGRITRSGE